MFIVKHIISIYLQYLFIVFIYSIYLQYLFACFVDLFIRDIINLVRC